MSEKHAKEALRQKVMQLEGRIKEIEDEIFKHIQEASKTLEKIIEMSDEGILVLDDGFKIEFANARACELTGYQRQNLIGMDLRDLLGRRQFDLIYSRLGEGERKRISEEIELKRTGGISLCAEMCIAVSRAGERKKIYAYLKDITGKKSLEREISEATKRFEKIAEMGEDGILILDENSRIIYANQRASEITGVSRIEILGHDFFSLIGRGDREFLGKVVRKGDGLGEKVCTEVEMVTPAGDVRATEVCIAPTRTDEGELLTYAYIHDITERKEFERNLRESEERYRHLFERVREGLFISTRDGQFIDCNPALLEMLGYDNKEEFLKLDISRDLYVNPEDRKRFQSRIEQNGFVKDFEVEFKKKSGDKITVLMTAHLMRDKDGNIIGYEGVNIDITDRKKMEKELRETNEFLFNLIEDSVDAIIVTDMKGNILIFNRGAENILGYKAGEVVGKMNIRDVYAPGMAELVMKKMRSPEYGGVGKLSSFPITHRRKDGELIEGDLSASIIYDSEGREVASVGIFKDLRERLRMERELHETREALLQSEKLAAMGRLTSQIAHELNNPIYGIMNTLELLKTEIPPESKRRRLLEMALSETQRLSEILKNMLSFSKPEEEEKRRVNVNELVEGILIVMEKQMKEANIQVETQLEDNLPDVVASPGQMRQVLLNMLKNAKEAMPGGGTLTVKTERVGSEVCIHIQDTGVGIPESIRDKIFDAFFTTKQKVKGVGLGLSVCYGIVKAHNGEIKVESEEGKGSTFRIHLPACQMD